MGDPDYRSEFDYHEHQLAQELEVLLEAVLRVVVQLLKRWGREEPEPLAAGRSSLAVAIWAVEKREHLRRVGILAGRNIFREIQTYDFGELDPGVVPSLHLQCWEANQAHYHADTRSAGEGGQRAGTLGDRLREHVSRARGRAISDDEWPCMYYLHPLCHAGDRVGVLALYSPQPDYLMVGVVEPGRRQEFFTELTESLSPWASKAAAQVVTLLSYRNITRKIAQFAEQVNEKDDLDELLNSACRVTRELARAHSCHIVRVDPETEPEGQGRVLALDLERGDLDGAAESAGLLNRLIKLEESMVGSAIRGDKPIFVNDITLLGPGWEELRRFLLLGDSYTTFHGEGLLPRAKSAVACWFTLNDRAHTLLVCSDVNGLLSRESLPPLLELVKEARARTAHGAVLDEKGLKDLTRCAFERLGADDAVLRRSNAEGTGLELVARENRLGLRERGGSPLVRAGDGIAGRLGPEAQAVAIPDVERFGDLVRLMEAYGDLRYFAADEHTLSEVVHPFNPLPGQQWAINLESRESRRFLNASFHTYVTSAIARLLTGAIRRLRAKRALQDSQQMLMAVLELSFAIGPARDLEDLSGLLSQRFPQTMGIKGFLFRYLKEDESRDLRATP